LKATFSKYRIDANLEAEITKAMTQNWSIQVTGLTYVSVDPASIQANFDNQTCADADLGWFKDNGLSRRDFATSSAVCSTSGSAVCSTSGSAVCSTSGSAVCSTS